MKISCVLPRELEDVHLREWQSLQSDVYDHPFFAPEYTRLISEVRDDVRIAIIENADETIGFFPYQMGPRGIGRPVGLRLADYQGPIIHDVNLDVSQLLRSCGLKSWHFDHMVSNCSALQPYRYGTAGSPYMDLSRGFEAYCQDRQRAGSSAIKQAERKARKLAREVGPLRFEMHSQDRQVFNTLIQWKSEYIRRNGVYRLLDMPWVLDVLERIWQTEMPSFSGRLSALYAGDKLLAAHLGICNQSVCHWWMTSYDIEYHKYSPGVTLLLRLADAAAADGMTRLDLGKGDEPYKHRMMSSEVQLGEGALTGSRMQRAVGRAWYHSRLKLRASALQPIAHRSKQIIRYGPWFGRSVNNHRTGV